MMARPTTRPLGAERLEVRRLLAVDAMPPRETVDAGAFVSSMVQTDDRSSASGEPIDSIFLTAGQSEQPESATPLPLLADEGDTGLLTTPLVGGERGPENNAEQYLAVTLQPGDRLAVRVYPAAGADEDSQYSIVFMNEVVSLLDPQSEPIERLNPPTTQFGHDHTTARQFQSVAAGRHLIIVPSSSSSYRLQVLVSREATLESSAFSDRSNKQFLTTRADRPIGSQEQPDADAVAGRRRGSVAGTLNAIDPSNPGIRTDTYELGRLAAGTPVSVTLATPSWSELFANVRLIGTQSGVVRSPQADPTTSLRSVDVVLENDDVYRIEVLAVIPGQTRGAYRIDASIIDTQPPVVLGVTEGGQEVAGRVIDRLTDRLTLRLSEDLPAADVDLALTLLAAGADDQFDTQDDQVIDLEVRLASSRPAEPSGGIAYELLASDPLLDGRYQLRVSDRLVDQSLNPIAAGVVSDFEIAAIGSRRLAGATIEAAIANPLVLERSEDGRFVRTVGGGIGRTDEDNQFFAFEAQAGEQISLSIRSPTAAYLYVSGHFLATDGSYLKSIDETFTIPSDGIYLIRTSFFSSDDLTYHLDLTGVRAEQTADRYRSRIGLVANDRRFTATVSGQLLPRFDGAPQLTQVSFSLDQLPQGTIVNLVATAGFGTPVTMTVGSQSVDSDQPLSLIIDSMSAMRIKITSQGVLMPTGVLLSISAELPQSSRWGQLGGSVASDRPVDQWVKRFTWDPPHSSSLPAPEPERVSLWELRGGRQPNTSENRLIPAKITFNSGGGLSIDVNGSAALTPGTYELRYDPLGDSNDSTTYSSLGIFEAAALPGTWERDGNLPVADRRPTPLETNPIISRPGVVITQPGLGLLVDRQDTDHWSFNAARGQDITLWVTGTSRIDESLIVTGPDGANVPLPPASSPDDSNDPPTLADARTFRAPVEGRYVVAVQSSNIFDPVPYQIVVIAVDPMPPDQTRRHQAIVTQFRGSGRSSNLPVKSETFIITGDQASEVNVTLIEPAFVAATPLSDAQRRQGLLQTELIAIEPTGVTSTLSAGGAVRTEGSSRSLRTVLPPDSVTRLIVNSRSEESGFSWRLGVSNYPVLTLIDRVDVPELQVQIVPPATTSIPGEPRSIRLRFNQPVEQINLAKTLRVTHRREDRPTTKPGSRRLYEIERLGEFEIRVIAEQSQTGFYSLKIDRGAVAATDGSVAGYLGDPLEVTWTVDSLWPVSIVTLTPAEGSAPARLTVRGVNPSQSTATGFFRIDPTGLLRSPTVITPATNTLTLRSPEEASRLIGVTADPEGRTSLMRLPAPTVDQTFDAVTIDADLFVSTQPLRPTRIHTAGQTIRWIGNWRFLTPTVRDGQVYQRVATGENVLLVTGNPTRQNVLLPGDVNGDGQVTPRDALSVINEVANRTGPPADRAAAGTTAWIDRVLRGERLAYADVNGDGHVTPIDALRIINRLRDASPTAGEPIEVVDHAVNLPFHIELIEWLNETDERNGDAHPPTTLF